MNEKRALNFHKINGHSLFTRQYIFVDTRDLLYEKIFADMGITVLKSKEFHKYGSDLRLIIIKILKHYEGKAEQAFYEVSKKAILLGYKEYEQACEKLIQIALGDKNER